MTEETFKLGLSALLAAGCVAAWILHLMEEARNRRELPEISLPIKVREEEPGLWVARSSWAVSPLLVAKSFEQIRLEALKEGPRLAVFWGMATFGQRVRVLLDVCV